MVKCPNCGSLNVRDSYATDTVEAAGRILVTGASIFGGLSQGWAMKAGKLGGMVGKAMWNKYKCENCGYSWFKGSEDENNSNYVSETQVIDKLIDSYWDDDNFMDFTSDENALAQYIEKLQNVFSSNESHKVKAKSAFFMSYVYWNFIYNNPNCDFNILLCLEYISSALNYDNANDEFKIYKNIYLIYKNYQLKDDNKIKRCLDLYNSCPDVESLDEENLVLPKETIRDDLECIYNLIMGKPSCAMSEFFNGIFGLKR